MGNSQSALTGIFDDEVRPDDINTDLIDEVLQHTPCEETLHVEEDLVNNAHPQSPVTKVPPKVTKLISKPFIVRRVKHIKQLYHYDGVTLGGGSSCSVMKMQERKTGNLYAVKKLKMSVPLHARLFQKEVEMLTTLQHPHIVRYHSHFADRNQFYIATELCSGTLSICVHVDVH